MHGKFRTQGNDVILTADVRISTCRLQTVTSTGRKQICLAPLTPSREASGTNNSVSPVTKMAPKLIV
ncbi:hypothetical protein RRG08_031885 [Elysia crispata]|uniref:Uncharacterized protein n=1 Tax=Elysia crispata TaxID=231223 RepID=A0AAE1AGR8_9GAST|nr:hypothetical protein RRG08_031885 [Elysia crispata]